MLCWGDLMDVRSGNAQIFTKTLVSVNFDPNAPKKWANTNAQNKTGFWSSRYIYIYINAYSPHFPSIVLQHWSPSRFSRLSFFKFHVMWQVLAILWYIIYITYIIFFKIILYYVIYIYTYIYIYSPVYPKTSKDGSRKWPPHCSPPRRGQAYLQQPGHMV